MKRLATILLAILTILPCHIVSTTPLDVQTDYAALTSTMLEGLTSLLDSPAKLDGSTVYLEYTGPVSLTSDARRSVDAFITSRGAVLSPEQTRADTRLTLSLTDASVVIVPSDGGCIRTVSVTLHIIHAKKDGTIVEAKGTTYTDSMHIPKDAIGKTSDASRFSRSVERTTVTGNRTAILAASLLVVSAVLMYFTFNY